MKINHETYLKNLLKTRKTELTNLNVQHRIDLATYEMKKEMLTTQINSLEAQLEA